MFKINGNDIYISRGEGATLTVIPVDESDEEYTFQTGDRQTLEVREHNGREAVLIIESPYTDFAISESDTAKLGGKYDYRVVLHYGAGGEDVIIGKTPNYTPHFYVLEG